MNKATDPVEKQPKTPREFIFIMFVIGVSVVLLVAKLLGLF